MAMGLSSSERELPLAYGPSVYRAVSQLGKVEKKLLLGTDVHEDHSHHSDSWPLKSKHIIVTVINLVGIPVLFVVGLLI